MQIERLKFEFDRLQKKFGASNISAIYGAGCIEKPSACFVFMNPTARNVAAHPGWQGLKAPWLGTKNAWRLFASLGLLGNETSAAIQKKKPGEWDIGFAHRVYKEIADKGIYVTNLSKSTQSDARALPDALFREYIPLFHEEMDSIRPNVIIPLGNQVSSIILGNPVKVSECRRTAFPLVIKESSYDVYPTYYPVGQGMRNMPKTIEDISWILEKRAAKR